MFESLVSSVLNSVLNTYIDDIDTEQVGTSLYSGKLSLYNLSLKPSLFDDTPLPFQLEYGNVGRIYIKIPFWDRFKSPLQIEIEDVFGLVSIKKMEDWSEETLKKSFQDAAQTTLETFEVFLKNQATVKDVQNQGSYSLGEKLMNRIIDNLQISIKNVYFRFEDNLSNIKSEATHKKMDTKFCFGLKLKEFKIFSADENYEKTQGSVDITKKKIEKEKDKLVYKVLKLDGFSLFCDWVDVDNPARGAFEHAKILAEEKATTAQDKASKKNAYLTKYLENEFSDTPSFQHSNIIENFTIQINAQLNKDPRNPTFPYSFIFPQYKVHMIIDATKTIMLYQPQIIRLLKTLELIGVFNEFKQGVLGDFLKQTLDSDKSKQYLQIYKQWKELYLVEKRSTAQEQTFKVKAAELRGYEDLVYYPKIIDLRKIVCKEMQVSSAKEKKLEEIEAKIQKEMGVEIGYGLMMSYKTKREIEDRIRKKYQPEIDDVNTNFGDSEVKISDSMQELLNDFEDEERQLASSLDTEGTQADENYDVDYHALPDDFCLMDIQMDMKTLGFTLQNEFSQDLFHLNFINYYFKMEQTKMNVVVDLKQQEIVMKDLWTGSKFYPNLIETTHRVIDEEDQNAEEFKDAFDDQDNVMEIKFEQNQNFKECPFHIIMNFHKPLQIVANFPLINEIQRTINEAMGKEKIDVDYYINLATGRINELRDQAKEIADQAIKGETQHANCSIAAKYNAPLLIVPDSIFSAKRNCLRINLGQISINSDLQVYDKTKEYYKMTKDSMSELYDDYTIDFKGLSVELLRFDSENELISKSNIVYKIIMKILIKNCLEPFHKDFESMIATMDFPDTILMKMEPSVTENLKGIIDTVMLQMVQLEYNIVGSKTKKWIEDSNKAHMESHKKEKKKRMLTIRDRLNTKILEELKDKKKDIDLKKKSGKRSQRGNPPAPVLNMRQKCLKGHDVVLDDGQQIESGKLNCEWCSAVIPQGTEYLKCFICDVKFCKYCNQTAMTQTPDEEMLDDEDEFFDLEDEDEQQQLEGQDVDQNSQDDENKDSEVGQIDDTEDKKQLEISSLKKSATDMKVIMLLRDFHIILGQTITKETSEQFGVSFRMRDLSMNVGLKDNGNKTEVNMSIFSIEIAENKNEKENFLDKIMFSNKRSRGSQKNILQYMLSKHLIKQVANANQDENPNVLDIQVNIQKEIEKSDDLGDVEKQVMDVNMNLRKSIFHMNMNFMARLVHKMGSLSKELEAQADDMVKKQDQIYNVLGEILSGVEGTQTTPIYSREYLHKLYDNLAIYHQKALYEKKEIYQFKMDYGEIIYQLQKDAVFTQTKEKEAKQDDEAPKEPQEMVPAEDLQKEELINIFFFKSHFFSRDIKKVRMNIEKFEFWLSDYNQDNIRDIANIMMFKFGMDIGLDQETLSKNLLCDSKRFDTAKVLGNDNFNHEDVPVQATELITRVMSNEQKITVDIKKMAIENQVYESWTQCFKRLDMVYISQEKQKKEESQELRMSLKEFSDQQKKNQAKQASKDETAPPVSFLLQECDISVTMTGSQEYFVQTKGKKEVTMPSMVLVMDYKDLSFLYFLSKRYEQLIAPELEQFQEKINEQIEYTKEAAKKSLKEKFNKPVDVQPQDMERDVLKDKLVSAKDAQQSTVLKKQKTIAAILEEEIADKFKDYSKKVKVEFKEGEIVDKEEEEMFVITTDQTSLKIDKIQLQFSDASLQDYVDQFQIDSTPLIQFFQKDLVLTLESYDNKAEPERNFPSENIKFLKQFNEYQGSKIISTYQGTRAFMNMAANFKFNATYFNQVTQNFEPFIEPWGMDVKVMQWQENDAYRIQVEAKDEFKFTASYGMAMSLRNIQAQTEQQFYSIDQIAARLTKGEKFPEGSIRAALLEGGIDDHELEEIKEAETSLIEPRLSKKVSKPLPKLTMKKKISMLKPSKTFELSEEPELREGQNEKSFKFVSNMQCDMVFCKSDPRLDDELRKSDDESHLVRFEAKQEPAIQHHVRGFGFFSKSTNISQFQYIENELKMIDVKFAGFDKVVRIPIETNGIYSYQTKRQQQQEQRTTRAQSLMDTIKRTKVYEDELKFLLRITSIGTQRIIYFESQLTFSNNQEFPLTLHFKFSNQYVPAKKNQVQDEFDEGDEVRIEPVVIQPMDTFNMPLAWFQLKDEPINVYLLCKDKFQEPANWFDQDPIRKKLLFENINQEFSKSASMTEYEIQQFNRVNQTKILELNDDFYTSVDIYGYKCFPKVLENKNPLQFYISLNPPLTILNSSMLPLTLFEIDCPESEDPIEKETSKIAPSCQKNIIELDTSEDNQSHIKLQFRDNDNNQFISKTLTQFSHPSKKKQAQDQVQYFKFVRHDSDKNKIKIMEEDIEQTEKVEKMDHQQFINIIFQRVDKQIVGVENADLRDRLIDQSSEINLEIYPSHILVNKSKYDLYNEGQKIGAKSSAILGLKRNQRFLELSAKVPEIGEDADDDPTKSKVFKKATKFDMTQIGITGILTMDSEDPRSKNQLQFGVSISLAPAPYDNTLVVTIVPRYTIVNNMDKQLEIMQSHGTNNKKGLFAKKNKVKDDTLDGIFDIIDCQQGKNSKEIHLDHLIKGKHGSVMEKLIFRLSNEDEKSSSYMSSQLGSASEQQISAILDSWSKPFSVEDIDDFQTQIKTSNESHYKMKHLDEEESKSEDSSRQIEWFMPNEQNNYSRIVRVLVTPNSSENDASLIITFSNPLHQRFVIKNKTNHDIYFRKFDYRNSIDLDKDPIKVPKVPGHYFDLSEEQAAPIKKEIEKDEETRQRIFAWDARDITETYIQILDDECKQKQAISLNLESKRDKVSNELTKFKLFKKNYWCEDVKKKVNIKFGVEINQNEGTKVLTVTCKRQDQQKVKPLNSVRSETYKQMKKTRRITEKSKTKKEIQREQQIDDAGYSSSDDEIYDEIKGKTSGIIFDLKMQGASISIINNEPQELMNITIQELELNYSNLLTKHSPEDDDKNGDDNKYDITKENVNFKLGNFQMDNLVNEEMPVMFAPQKLFIKQLLQKKLDNKNGELHKEYNDFAIEKMEYNNKNEDQEEMDEQQKLQRLLLENEMPFLKFEMSKREKTNQHMKGSIVRYKKIHFAMQEFFYSVETQIIIKMLNFSKTLGRIMDEGSMMGASSHQREQQKIKQNLKWDETSLQKSYEVCPFIDATQGILMQDNLSMMDRISFGILMLGSIKCSLSVKLMNAKLSDFGVQAGGMVNILLPVFSSLASLKNCNIFFNELIIIEGYVSQEMLFKTINNHYYYQVKNQVLKILGCSQMLGNPTNLVGKVGTGFYELARDPLVGMAQGPGGFARGLKKGVQAGVGGIIGGGAASAGQASGAMYSAITNASGLGDTKNQVEVTSLRQGIGNGAYGAAQELKKGTVAFFSKPVEGAKRGGLRGFMGGIKSGTGAAMAGPLAAITRGTESVSKGVEASATNFSNHGKTQLQIFDPKYFRVRPSRRINLKGQIEALENYDLLFIQSYLNELDHENKDKFKYQEIKWYSILPQIDGKGLYIPEQINVVVITQDYLLLFEVVNFVDLRKAQSLRRRLLHECICLNQIAKYSLHKSNDGETSILSVVRSTQTKNKVKVIQTHDANSQPITRVNGQDILRPKKPKQGEEISKLPEALSSCSKIFVMPDTNNRRSHSMEDTVQMALEEKKLKEKFAKSKRIQRLCKGEKKQTILVGDIERLTDVFRCLQSIHFITETVKIVQMFEFNPNDSDFTN